MPPKIIELAPGEQPRETPYLLVDCVVGGDSRSIRHSSGVTERVNLDDLEAMLPLFVDQASREGLSVVYVRRSTDREKA